MISVIKVGGSIGINYDLVCDDLAELWKEGRRFVLVHGGSGETNEVSTKLGKPPRTLTTASGMTSRYTDQETMDIFAMVYAGKMNVRIVERLQKRGVNALGLTGVDGRLLEGQRKGAIKAIENGRPILIRDDYSGKVEKVNTGLLSLLVDAGYLPVVTPPAISVDGDAINVDGDRASAMIASSLGAEELIILSNVPGLLKSFPDESSLIPHIPYSGLEEALGFAEGRMKKKVLGATEALAGGVKRVVFADARIQGPVKAALGGQGTVIER